MKKYIIVSCLTMMIINFNQIRAGIVDSSFYGFTVSNEININAIQDSVFSYIINDIGKWWDPEHTYSGNAANLSIQTSAQGCFCENLPGGGIVRHMTVIYVDPGKVLRLSGGLGPLQSMAVNGTMTFTLSKETTGTKLSLRYTVGGYTTSGLSKIAVMVDQVLGQQMQRFKNYVETLPGPSDTGRSDVKIK
jgi:hypothetical protein